MTDDPRTRVAEAFERIDEFVASVDDATFISLADRDTALSNLDPNLPLSGRTFAVKDNIDVAGLATTGGCPSFAWDPTKSATAVRRLTEAGATCVGKTNLDQFATGLVGTRSPYGTPINPIDKRLIPGGSSSGSAVAVARRLVDFSLGTDTAGSGRVPAAHNRIVGMKPSRGMLPMTGVLPAVRSIDCLSIFAQTVAGAWAPFEIATGFDANDAFSRQFDPTWPGRPPGTTLRVGIAAGIELDSELDQEAWNTSVDGLSDQDFELRDIDISTLVEVGQELYGGPWVAERYAAIGDFLETNPADADPIVSGIVLGGKGYSAVDAYRAAYRLAEMRRSSDDLWERIDVLMVPTIPGVATLAEVEADPVGRNSRLGRFTNWVNLLDQSAVAIPGTDRQDGWPFGVTLIGPAGTDAALMALAGQLSDEHLPDAVSLAQEQWLDLAVVGAHLAGQPLNWQLTDLGGQLISATQTTSDYRLLSLAHSSPPKPGLVHVEQGGASIEVEIWRLPTRHVGTFLGQIPAPLGLGTLHLADGTTTKGFIAEPRAEVGAEDITHHGGWRAFLSSRAE